MLIAISHHYLHSFFGSSWVNQGLQCANHNCFSAKFCNCWMHKMSHFGYESHGTSLQKGLGVHQLCCNQWMIWTQLTMHSFEISIFLQTTIGAAVQPLDLKHK